MKPQLYSIVILLLARINYAQNADNSTQASGTQLPSIPPDNTTTSLAKTPADNVTSTTKAPDDHKTSLAKTPEDNVTSTTKAPDDHKTSVAKTPEDNVTSTTKAPDDHKTSAPATTENNVTRVTEAPEGNLTSVTKTPRETVVSEIPTEKVTVLSEAPNSKAASAPSLAPTVSPVRTTEGFMMTSRSGGISRATGSTGVSIGNQTANPIPAGNATTQRINKVTNAVRKTTSTKRTTAKATGNRTSAFPGPSWFAMVLLVISVLCF